MKCYKCKKGTLRPAEVPEQVEVSGHKFTGNVAALKCSACGEVLIDGPALERFELLAAAKLAEAGEATGEAFKFMRKAVGLRAIDLASLLGVAAETGTLPTERRAIALLGAIVAEAVTGSTATLKRLHALKEPSKLPKVIRLEPQTA